MKLLIPVGITAARTSPVIVYASVGKTKCPIPRAITGIAKCKINKQTNNGKGFFRTFRKSRIPRLILPAKVMKANNHGDKKV
ncbi:hypothetical protein D3C75_1047280 [compost metagenome]